MKRLTIENIDKLKDKWITENDWIDSIDETDSTYRIKVHSKPMGNQSLNLRISRELTHPYSVSLITEQGNKVAVGRAIIKTSHAFIRFLKETYFTKQS